MPTLSSWRCTPSWAAAAGMCSCVRVCVCASARLTRGLSHRTGMLLQVGTAEQTQQLRNAGAGAASLAAGQVSIERSVAAMLRVQNREEVRLTVISDRSSVALLAVRIRFKEQYLSRGDMLRLAMQLNGACVHEGKRIALLGMRVSTHDLMDAKGASVLSGVITEQTRMTFSSTSAQLVILIDVSREMWDWDHSGDVMWEVVVNGFLATYGTRLRERDSNHEVTVIMHWRCSAAGEDSTHAALGETSTVEDVYRVIVSGMPSTEWAALLHVLRQAFLRFPSTIAVPERLTVSRRSCFLEAVNLALDMLGRPNVDRSLERTGRMLVAVSAGVGAYDCSESLAKITKLRFRVEGINCALACMAPPPPHMTPLLCFPPEGAHITGVCDPSKWVGDWTYAFPLWLRVAYYMDRRLRPFVDQQTTRARFALPGWDAAEWVRQERGSNGLDWDVCSLLRAQLPRSPLPRDRGGFRKGASIRELCEQYDRTVRARLEEAMKKVQVEDLRGVRVRDQRLSSAEESAHGQTRAGGALLPHSPFHG
jgi:hypothetical protein